MSYGVAVMLGGTAGEGLETAGEGFARALAAAGHKPSTQRDFPSRIRGGDTTSTVRIAPGGHLCPPKHIDLAIAFNATVLPRMDKRLTEGSLLLVDEGIEFVSTHGAEVKQVPFSAIAKEAGLPRAKNIVALGAATVILGIPEAIVESAINHLFEAKGEKLVQGNLAAFEAGVAHAREHFTAQFPLPAPSEDPALWLSGNEAVCLGAIAAGCRIAAAYPITPASDILEYLTPRLKELGGHAIQVEDEIAAMNVVVGAGFAGARALTATSGPGLSLMSEVLGLAGTTETPSVIIDCQRPGPSTGMPTKHGQEDLWHMVHGGHGEWPRVVLAPTDVGDAFHTTVEAFRLADRFRCPAFVAMDAQMDLFKQTSAPFDLDEAAGRMGTREPNPHAEDADAWNAKVAPYGDPGDAPVRTGLPGEPGGMYYANSTEHGPNGFTNEDPTVRVAMVDRRLKRLEAIAHEADRPLDIQGDASDTVIVSWGSTVEACREAQERASQTRVIGVRLLWPFPKQAFKEAVGDAKRILVVEANAMGQLARLIRSELPLHDRITEVKRYDGTPVLSDDVLEAL